MPPLLFEKKPLYDLALSDPRLAAHRQRAAGWALSRQQDYLAGRRLALQSLVDEGVLGDVSLAATDTGAVQWPTGWVGSLSHSQNHVALALAQSHQFVGVGVDVEADARLPEDAAGLVITAADQQHWPRERWHWLFSAKECVYKALHPLTGLWLDFDEVCIVPQPHQSPNQDPSQPQSWLPQPLSQNAQRAFAGWTWQTGWQKKPQQGVILVWAGLQSGKKPEKDPNT